MSAWDVANPADNGIISAFPPNERNARTAVRDNFGVDHHATEDATIGMHDKVSLISQGSDPTAGAGKGLLYTKTPSGVELYFRDAAGNVLQITNAGVMQLLSTTNTWTAANTFSHASNNFTGVGTGLTALNATQLTSGTVPDARFPATLPALNGSALTALNATQLTSGTVPDARFPATLPALNGSALTALNASNIASGTLAIARHAAVVLRNVTSGQTSGSVTVSTSGPTGGSSGDIWLTREA